MRRPGRAARYGLIAAGLLLCLLVPAVSGAEGGPEPVPPVAVASPVDPRVAPALAFDDLGRLYLAWRTPVNGGQPASLHVATWPLVAEPITLPVAESAESAGTSRAWPSLQLVTGVQPTLAWATGTGPDALATTTVLPGGEDASWAPGNPDLWTHALAPDGRLYVAWEAADMVVIEQPSGGDIWTFRRDPATPIDTLMVSVDTDGWAWVAWSIPDGRGSSGGVWYAPLQPGARAVRLADSGRVRAIAAAPGGLLHIVWAEGDSLWYAGVGGGVPASERITTASATGTPVALAAGRDGSAHMAWAGGDVLWQTTYAGRLFAPQTVATGNAVALALAVDSLERTHLAWIDASSGTPTLWALVPAPAQPQIRITWPEAGSRTDTGDWAQAETNLPPAHWDRMAFYLQPAGEVSGDGGLWGEPLQELGVDEDGADGWRIGLAGAQVDSPQTVRLVVIGRDAEGRVRRAAGEPFELVPAGMATVLGPAGPEPVSGNVRLEVLPAPGQSLPEDVELYLTPYPRTGRETTDLIHAGTHRLQGEGYRSLVLNSRDVPDGNYSVSIGTVTATGVAVIGAGAAPLMVDNTRPPTVVSVRWLADARGRVSLEAIMDPTRQGPRRVDFYLQHTASAPVGATVLPGGDLIRVGSDTDGSEGWSATVEPPGGWFGQRWVAWAVACDARELCGSAVTGPHTLPQAAGPALWIEAPGAGASLSGTVPVALSGDIGLEQVLRAEAYVQREGDDLPADTLHRLGYLRRSGRGWVLAWNTPVYADGDYRLLVEVTLGSGARVDLVVDGLRVANGPRSWLLEGPDTVAGAVALTLRPAGGDQAATGAWLNLVDAEGGVTPLGNATSTEGGWEAIWNTRTVMDGEYTIVAQVDAGDGSLTYAERAVRVANDLPLVGFVRAPSGTAVRGEEAIAWYSEAGDLAVALEYSPDDGLTWLTLAEGLGPNGYWVWDTATVPDSAHARLRLVADDGTALSAVTHGPFAVDNRLATPSVVLLAPEVGATLGRESTVRWLAGDADDTGGTEDGLTVDLLYRLGQGPWRPLATGLGASGEYVWDMSGLPEGEASVRAVARDARGATGDDRVDGLTIVQNRAPVVNLIWPDESLTLTAGAALLWETADPDGDTLRVDLFYSDNDGLNWYPLAEDLDDVGFYVWQVSFLPPGRGYRVRVVARDAHTSASDESMGSITVVSEGLPVVDLAAPLAGETLRGTVAIVWQPGWPAPDGAYYDVLVRVEGDTDWRVLKRDLRRASHWLWDTTRLPDGSYDLAVRLRSATERVLSNTVMQLRLANGLPGGAGLALLEPVGGQVLAGWHVMRWHAGTADPAATATLELSADAGATWQELATVPAAQEYLLWDTDAWPAGSHYLARITVAAGENRWQATTAGPLALGGRGLWPPGVALTPPPAGGSRLTWSVEDSDGDPLGVALTVCGSDGGGCVVVGEPVAPAGSYTLPEAPAVGAQTAAVVADDGLYRVEDRAAWEVAAPDGDGLRLVLLAPQGGGAVPGNVLVAWEASAEGEPVSIDIAVSADGGLHWRSIIDELQNVGRYLWQTILTPNGSYRLRVAAESGSRRVERTSDAFDLDVAGRHAPQVSLSVDAGRVGRLGSRAVTWTARDRDGSAPSVRVEYSVGPGGPWHTLATGLGAGRSAGWAGSALPNGNNLWLRLVATDGVFEAMSPPAGPLTVENAGAPRVRITSPAVCEPWTGTRDVAWSSTSGAGLTVTLSQSLDGGFTWGDVATELPSAGALAWDSTAVPDGSAVLFRATAQAGDRLGTADAACPVIVRGNAQPADITP